jgi:hypothetical protein
MYRRINKYFSIKKGFYIHTEKKIKGLAEQEAGQLFQNPIAAKQHLKMNFLKSSKPGSTLLNVKRTELSICSKAILLSFASFYSHSTNVFV